ncbi:hypothetical protein [Mesorhizobium hawassense]|uniref:hypothetical protein n=1 Tax=Mesorhizobium hawassense TaxID=1209954 RepID=UPI0011BDC44A|nr:hypothetical protein [Mesorhizobium hawassense]
MLGTVTVGLLVATGHQGFGRGQTCSRRRRPISRNFAKHLHRVDLTDVDALQRFRRCRCPRWSASLCHLF